MCGPQRLDRAGDALRVGEHEAVAEAAQARDRLVEALVEALERAFEEQPRRVRGTLGDVGEVVLGALERVLVGELAALVQADVQALGVDRGLDFGAAGGQFLDAHARVGGAADVRGAGDVEDVLVVEAAGVAEGLSHRLRPVVQTGKQMAVEVNVSHCL